MDDNMFLNAISEKNLILGLSKYFDLVKIIDRSHVKCTKFNQTIIFVCYNIGTKNNETSLELFKENNGEVDTASSIELIIKDDNIINVKDHDLIISTTNNIIFKL